MVSVIFTGQKIIYNCINISEIDNTVCLIKPLLGPKSAQL